MLRRRLCWVPWVSLALACLIGCTPQSCSSQGGKAIPSTAATRATLSTADDATAHYGGTPQAWVTPAGDAPDSNHCAANLRLPLEPEPAWVHEYGYGFSAVQPSAVVHFDGTLYVTSASPLLLGIDARTGEQVFNKPVYKNRDVDRDEVLSRVFIHPDGTRMAGQDDMGRHYCWDITARAPQELWVGGETGVRSGYVVFGDSLFTGWSGNIFCLDLDNGRRRWSYPNLLGTGGVVLGLDGVLISWSASNDFIALDAADGSLLWSYMDGVRIEGAGRGAQAIIDDELHRVYLVLANEWVQCRELATGAVAWEHNWADIVRPERRQALADYQGTLDYPMPFAHGVLTPDGLVLPVKSGCVLALDHAGERRWVYYSDTSVIHALGFDNAVLVSEQYWGREARGVFEWLKIFCTQPPSWPSYLNTDEDQRERGIYGRLVVLDTASGEQLDTFDPGGVLATITPAYDKVVLGEAGSPGDRTHRIVAYNWIDWDGD